MRKLARAHGSAKIHEDFQRIPPLRTIIPLLRPIIPLLRPIIPPLRPIIDTIGIMHYRGGKFTQQHVKIHLRRITII